MKFAPSKKGEAERESYPKETNRSKNNPRSIERSSMARDATTVSYLMHNYNASPAFHRHPPTRFTATPSASMRGISFNEIPVITPEEIQAARTIQGMKTASGINSTPKTVSTTIFSSSNNTTATTTTSTRPNNALNSCSPAAPFNNNSGNEKQFSESRPQAKRKLHLNTQQQKQQKTAEPIISYNDNTDLAFKTPKNKVCRRRKASEISTSSSLGSPATTNTTIFSPTPAKSKNQCFSPNSTRYDTSLCVLTQRFIDYMDKSADGIVNLNESAEALGVPKRRIYDITNVLEGIDLVEKAGKNSVRWRMHRRFMHKNNNKIFDPNFFKRSLEVEDLKQRETTLDSLIRLMQDHLYLNVNNGDHKNFGYTRYEDLCYRDEFQNKTVLAVKAPTDSIIEVPDPAETNYKTYQMAIRSQKGQIEALLCPIQKKENFIVHQQQKQHPLQHAVHTQIDFTAVKTEPAEDVVLAESCNNAAAVNFFEPPTEATSPTLFEQAMKISHFQQQLAQNIQNMVHVQPDHLQQRHAHTHDPPMQLIEHVHQQIDEPQMQRTHIFGTPNENNEPFLSLEPELENADDYLFALEPHEGLVDLFGITDSDFVDDSMTSPPSSTNGGNNPTMLF